MVPGQRRRSLAELSHWAGFRFFPDGYLAQLPLVAFETLDDLVGGGPLLRRGVECASDQFVEFRWDIAWFGCDTRDRYNQFVHNQQGIRSGQKLALNPQSPAKERR